MVRKNVIDGNSNTKWNLLTLALVNSSNKHVLSGWKWRDAHFGFEESRREQFRLQEELVMKEKAL